MAAPLTRASATGNEKNAPQSVGGCSLTGTNQRSWAIATTGARATSTPAAVAVSERNGRFLRRLGSVLDTRAMPCRRRVGSGEPEDDERPGLRARDPPMIAR